MDYCNLNLKGLDEPNEDNNESSLVLEYIQAALANNYNIKDLLTSLIEQYESLLE